MSAPPATIERPPALAQQPAPPGRPKLAKALAAAQGAVKDVPKDAVNLFHKYMYASAEAVIGAAKVALSSHKLALLPLEQNLTGSSADGGDRYELERKFILLHKSGECAPLTVHWPVVIEKGRPLDKATAVAATASLAYLLRDLLLIPRVAPDEDMAARQDRPQPQERPARRDERAPKKEKPLPADGAELLAKLKDYDAQLVKAGLCKPGELVAHVVKAAAGNGHVAEVARWDEPTIRWAVEEAKSFHRRMRGKAAAPPAPRPAPPARPVPSHGDDVGRAREEYLFPLLSALGKTLADLCVDVGVPPDTRASELTDAEFNKACLILERQAPEPAPAR